MVGIPLFIAFVFVLFVCAFAFGIARALLRWTRNNNSPLVSTPASVVSKRNRVSGGSGDSSASTSYFVTFEIQGGERLEFHLAGTEFGMLVERDRGTLSYQAPGTRLPAHTPGPLSGTTSSPRLSLPGQAHSKYSTSPGVCRVRTDQGPPSLLRPEFSEEGGIAPK